MTTVSFNTISLSYFSNSATLFDILAAKEYAIFLDSCSDRRKESGTDVLTCAPYLRFIARNNQFEIYDVHNHLIEKGENALERLLKLEANEKGCLLGYLGYHCNDSFFQLQKKESLEDHEMPDICLGFYGWRIEVNHNRKTCELKYLADKLGETELKILISQLNLYSQNTQKNKYLQLNSPLAAISNFNKESYFSAFQKIKSYINMGDCYQVNLAQRFSMPFNENPWAHYQILRNISPAPYACYFSTPFGNVLSFSPESFLEISASGKMISKPIKGTRKRHIDMSHDLRAAEELANSEKDKAENLMIVDLIRNDLSKSAMLNSVKVDKLFDIQSFANVHHMVSQISAQKNIIKSHLDVLLDCFPGGSITGAPKKRAMEIIKELEPNNRQVYCGAIGQIDFDGNLSFNIAIRTLIIKNKMLYCWGGGGLVADSNAEEEYQESIAKISNLIPV